MALRLNSRALKTSLATIVALSVCLALPALAAAAGFEVDSNGDQPDASPGSGGCATAVATCTLRAAIEEANDGASADEITFAPSFGGAAGATITPATALPKVTQPLTIEGGRCTGVTGFAGPCVGLVAPSGQPGLVLAAPLVTVRGLAVTAATTAIELESTAVRAKIAGNWIGLTLAGTAAANQTGVTVGAAAEAVVGGAAATDANRFSGGAIAISVGPGSKRAAVEGNLIGLNLAASAALASPSEAGIDVDASGESSTAEMARIAANRIAMLRGDAIRQRGGGAQIVANLIGQSAGGAPLAAGDVGVHLENSQSVASVVEGNTIVSAGRYGLLIENANNRVLGNTILNAAVNGIRIVSSPSVVQRATGNLIGEDAASTENTVSGSGGAAIAIVDEPVSGNIVARVKGSANGGLFIDRGADGVGNRGESTALAGGSFAAITAPVVDVATRTGAGGTTNVPGAVIRVYAKQTASPGELGQMIATATSGGEEGREWAVTYPRQPLGSYVAVTASSYTYGTSELAIAPADGLPPRAKIVAGPRRRVYKRTVKFRFTANEVRTVFFCKLDSKPWRSCKSPLRYRHLKRGFHIFRVRAKDAAGNVQPRPTVRRFKVLRHKLRHHR